MWRYDSPPIWNTVVRDESSYAVGWGWNLSAFWTRCALIPELQKPLLKLLDHSVNQRGWIIDRSGASLRNGCVEGNEEKNLPSFLHSFLSSQQGTLAATNTLVWGQFVKIVPSSVGPRWWWRCLLTPTRSGRGKWSGWNMSCTNRWKQAWRTPTFSPICLKRFFNNALLLSASANPKGALADKALKMILIR